MRSISRIVAALIATFVEPIPLPIQLSVWPKVIVGVAVVASYVFVSQMRLKKHLVLLTIAGFVLVSGGIACGFWYWLLLPTTTLEVRNAKYVIGTPTAETLQLLQSKGLENTNGDIRKLINGQSRDNEVESYFTPASVWNNKLALGIRYIAFLAITTIGIMILFEWMPGKAANNPPAAGSSSVQNP